ncbi:fibronectin type III domain-containing protein [Geotalea uraniireducens]|nr:IPT/TIG domain-containing protein [Geotalea uraniireducens]
MTGYATGATDDDFDFVSLNNGDALIPTLTVDYTPPPTVTGISPSSGPVAGGTSVTISGANFTSATAVTFGSTNATSYTVNSATQITATSPAGSAGTVDITVTTAGGTSATGASDQFTYIAAPTVTSISPTSGPTDGSTSVTITGTNFTGATTVTIGGAAATSVTVVNATTLTATTPSGTAGVRDVVVTTPGGTGTGTGLFTYKASQTITFNSPGAQNFGTTPTLTAIASSGLTPTFTSSTTGVCTITSGGALTFATTGTCTINAGQAGDSTYLAALPVSQSFSVAAVVPGAPTIGTATAGDTQASVTFTAPASNGGASITGYTATSNPGGVTGTCASSPCTVTGLTNGTAYTFTVTATNSAGTGSASAASNSVTPAAAQTITFNNPGAQNFGIAPTLTATASSGLMVSFTSSTTGVCTVTAGGALTFVTAGTCTINADQAGNGSFTAAPMVTRSFAVNAVVPGAPTIGTATAGDTQASITFSAPASNGGASITSYTATSNPGGLTGTCASSPCTVTGLTNGTAYTFTVTATNSAGTGSASAASNSVTPAAAQTITFNNPGAQNFGTSPTLTATATSSLTVTFTSSTTGVCTVTAGGALTFVTTGTCTINADQAGNGSFLAATTVSRSFTVIAVVPGAPTIGIATAGDTQASVAFTAPVSNGGASITGYTVTSNPGGLTSSGASSPITVTGLTNGTAYTFTVTAHNSAGTGSASSASNSVTPNPGPTVVNVAVPANGIYKAGSNLDFTVTWDSAATVTGTPRIALLIGSAMVYATYQSGSGTASTLFRYTVLPGQTDTDGITVGALSLNGGTIQNSSGTDATLTLNSVASTVNVLVDTTAPTLSSIATSNPTHSGGTLTATANENALGSWIAVSSSATAPTVAQVLAGADYGGVTVVAHGSGALSAGSAVSFSLSGLVAATSYDIYLAAQDAAGNPSAAVSSATLITTTTRVVTTSSDSGPGSLRQTIADANPGDIILFDPSLSGQTVTIASPLVIAKDLSIGGYDARPITINGGGTTRIFQVSGSTTFTLNYLTLTDGVATDGGAISDNVNATTFISLCTFSGNTATAAGGAISAAGTMSISDTLFAGNSAVQGGAIFNNNALSLVNVTLANNSANSGGGIYSSGGSTLVKNTTIAGNNATVQGGGIEIASGAVGFRNSIVAGNTSPSGPDISGFATSLGYNLVKDTSGATFTVTTGDLTGQDPLLGPLADNGGPIKTMALLLGSPAIDSGACTGASATDQRSMPRPQNGLCDMGAYERGVPAALTATGGTPQSAAIDAAFATPLKAKVTDSLGGVMEGISVTFAGPGSGADITADGSVTTDAAGIASYGVTANGTAGAYTVTATVNALIANFNLTNDKANQAITFNPPATATFGDAPIALSATGGASGNPVIFSVASGPGSLNGATLTITGAGNIVVTASQAGNANYNAAPQVIRNIAIGKGAATIALGSLNATYDGTAKAVTATTTPAGLAVIVTYGGSSTPPTAAGSYPVAATIDDANYSGTATGTLVIAYSATPPVLTISTLADGSVTNNATLNVSGQATSINGITSVTVNGAAVTLAADGTFSQAVTLQAGTNTVTTIATDNAGTTTTDSRTITLDTTAPVITITTPADNSTLAASSVTITGSVDKNATVQATANSGSPQSAAMTNNTFTVTLNLAGGSNTIVISATDLAGNSASVKRTIVSDTTKPTLAITNPSQDITISEPALTISGTVTDALTDVSVTITCDGKTYTPQVVDGAFQQQLTFVMAKQYAITVTATDQAGNSVTTQRNVIYALSSLPSGDINGDGKVDIADALLALQMAVGLITPTSAQLATGDVAPLSNGKPAPDGAIDIADAMLILEKAVGMLTW